MKRLLFAVTLVISPALTALSQPLTPQDLFDTSVNLAYLEAHSQYGGGEASWDTWADNTNAEWDAAWGDAAPSVWPVAPYPAGAIIAYGKIELYLMTNGSAGCLNPWHRNVLTLFNAGYRLGAAFVETNYGCPSCLRADLYSASLSLERMGNDLSAAGLAAGSVMLGLAESLRATAENVERTPNAAAADVIQAALTGLNAALPDDPVLCNDLGEEPGPDAAAEVSCPRRIESTDYDLVVLSRMHENIYYFKQPGQDYFCGYVMNFGLGTGLHRGTHVLTPLPHDRGYVHLNKRGDEYVEVAELLIDNRNCDTTKNRAGQTRTILCGDRVRLDGSSKTSRFRLYQN